MTSPNASCFETRHISLSNVQSLHVSYQDMRYRRMRKGQKRQQYSRISPSTFLLFYFKCIKCTCLEGFFSLNYFYTKKIFLSNGNQTVTVWLVMIQLAPAGRCANYGWPLKQIQGKKKVTHCARCPERASLQMGCSASVSQNSQASRDTFSSGSCVRCSMYCGNSQQHHQHLRWVNMYTTSVSSSSYLNDAAHVRDESVNSHLQEHDQSPAHVLPHLRVLVCGQRKQTLE